MGNYVAAIPSRIRIHAGDHAAAANVGIRAIAVDGQISNSLSRPPGIGALRGGVGVAIHTEVVDISPHIY